MLKIKDNVDLKELKRRKFYLEGNTYKRDVGKGKCLAICTINREIIKPKLGKWDSKIKDTVEEILFLMCLDGLVENSYTRKDIEMEMISYDMWRKTMDI